MQFWKDIYAQGSKFTVGLRSTFVTRSCTAKIIGTQLNMLGALLEILVVPKRNIV